MRSERSWRDRRDLPDDTNCATYMSGEGSAFSEPAYRHGKFGYFRSASDMRLSEGARPF
jgi:hypothetical protein